MQVVGANLDQIGIKPLQNPSGPSFAKIFEKQSTNPLQILASCGWFINLVLMISNGDTVHDMKNPAVKAAVN